MQIVHCITKVRDAIIRVYFNVWQSRLFFFLMTQYREMRKLTCTSVAQISLSVEFCGHTCINYGNVIYLQPHRLSENSGGKLRKKKNHQLHKIGCETASHKCMSKDDKKCLQFYILTRPSVSDIYLLFKKKIRSTINPSVERQQFKGTWKGTIKWGKSPAKPLLFCHAL